MSADPRDQLWDAVHDTYYESYFYERVADNMVDRWQLMDEVTKVLVAVTASGSAVAGWTLWTQAGLEQFWAIAAGLAALLAIVHPTLTVPRRLADWGDSKRDFLSLRIEFENAIKKMELNSEFAINDIETEFFELRKKFGDYLQSIKNDILLTRSMKEKCQIELNQKLNW